MMKKEGLSIEEIKKIAFKYGFRITGWYPVEQNGMEQDYSGELLLEFDSISYEKAVLGRFNLGFRNETACHRFFYYISDYKDGNEFSKRWPKKLLKSSWYARYCGLAYYK